MNKANIIKQIIHICLYLILIIPFFVWGKFLFPYISPKTFAFRILIEIAIFFYILLIIYQPQYRPRFSKLTWIILIYIIAITLASIFGVDPYRSFWGNIERGEGLLTVYHLFAFYILITSLFKEKKDWLRYFNFSALVSILMSLYALGQKFELGSLMKSAGGSRLAGTIGNASFLAAYLLLSIFIILFLFINSRSRNWRIFYGAAFLFEAYILFETQTRGALLGFFGGLILVAILGVIFSKNRKVKLGAIALLLILIIAASSIWFLRDSESIKNIKTLERLVSISFDDITTQSRLLGWQAAWKGWQDRFVFGYGYENYNVAFNKYFPAPIYRDSGSQIWFDRAHNIFFDQAVTGGILGILSYLGILVLSALLLLSWLRKSRKEENSPAEIKSEKNNFNHLGFIILIGLLASYFAQNMFVFDTMGTYILFYSVLGFITYLSFNQNNAENSSTQQNNERNAPKSFLVIVLSFILIFTIYIFNIKPAIANTTCIKGLSYAYRQNYIEAMDEFKKSLSYGTYQAPEIRQNLSQIVGQAAKSGQFENAEIQEIFEFAIDEMRKNLEKSPQNARHYLFAVYLYKSAAEYAPEYYNKVLEGCFKGLELSPTRPQFYYVLGQTKFIQGEYEKGIEYLEKALALNPKVMESRWNLAAGYIIAGEDELAEEEFKTMAEMGFDYYSAENLSKMINIYSSKKNFEKVVSLYQEMIKLQPDNAILRIRLAENYEKIGEIEKAKEAVKKAAEIDPSLEEKAAEILDLLGNLKNEND